MEVMITAVILSAGLVAVYRSFFIGVNYLDHLACRLRALNMIESRIADIERGFRLLNNVDVGVMAETATVNNRPVEFRYEIQLVPVDDLLTVFRLDMALTWDERGHQVTINRSAYFSGVTSVQNPGGNG